MCYIIAKQFSTLPVRSLLEILMLSKMIVYGGNDGVQGLNTLVFVYIS